MAILTISRHYGSGGAQIGRMVAGRLGYTFMDKALFHRDLLARGEVWARLDMEMKEVSPDLWERNDRRYQAYLAQLEDAILSRAAAGKVVIVGRAASVLLKNISLCLKVRVVAPLPLRIPRIMEREGIKDRKTAEELVQEIDQDRAQFVRINYGVSTDDATAYDIMINTSALVPEEAALALEVLLAERDQRANSQDGQTLAGMALAAKLRARLTSEPKLVLPTLAVRYAEQAVEVSAVIRDPQQGEMLRRLSREILGDYPLRLALKPRG